MATPYRGLFYKRFAEPKPACFASKTTTKEKNVKRNKQQNEAGEAFAAFIGIDWADQKHQVCLWACDSHRVESLVISQRAEKLRQWVNGLRERFAGRRVAICLEQSRGPLIYALLGYDFIVLYPVNPRSLAKYREAFRLAQAKDDPSDAELLLDLIRKHRAQLRAWQSDDEQTRLLSRLGEDRRKAVNWQTRLSNQLKATLKDYFPGGTAIGRPGTGQHARLRFPT